MELKIKNKSKKILIVLLIILAVLSTALAIKVYAYNRNPEEECSNPDFPANAPDIYMNDKAHGRGPFYWFNLEDYLDPKWYILCSRHHTNIPICGDIRAKFGANIAYWASGKLDCCGFVFQVPTDHHLYEAGDSVTVHTCEDGPASSIEWINGPNSITFGRYHKVVDNHVGNPAESFILAEAESNFENPHDNAEVQNAFWNTWAGHVALGGDTGAHNTLWEIAESFQLYICKVMGLENNAEARDPESHFFCDHAELYPDDERSDAPFLHYDPVFYDVGGDPNTHEKYKDDQWLDVNHDGQVTEKDKVTVSFEQDKNVYVIGPYSIDYIEASCNGVDFSKIIAMTIGTNIGSGIIIAPGEEGHVPMPQDYNPDIKWKIRIVEGSGRPDPDFEQVSYSNPEFPHKDEIFYIEIEYLPELKTFTGMDVEFKYMNAGSTFDMYDGVGKFRIITWDDTPSSVGIPPENPTKWIISIRVKSVADYDSQGLTYIEGEGAKRWYKYHHLTTEGADLLEATITVEKELIDDNGNKIIVDGQYAFDIFVDYKDGKGEQKFETLIVDVKNGYGRKTTTPITWKIDGNHFWDGNNDGDGIDVDEYWNETTLPSYRVEEVNIPDNVTGRSIENASGTLGKSQNVVVKAKNALEKHKGKLRIDKEFINILHPLQKDYLENQKYYFKVTLTGEFECNFENYPGVVLSGGEEIAGGGKEVWLLVAIDKNSKVDSEDWAWESNEIIWYDINNPPQYKVEELKPKEVVEDEIFSRYPGIEGMVVNPDAEYYYELVSSTGASGSLVEIYETDGNGNVTDTLISSKVIAYNQPTFKITTIQINKEVIGQEKPGDGDVFLADLIIGEEKLIFNPANPSSNNSNGIKFDVVEGVPSNDNGIVGRKECDSINNPYRRTTTLGNPIKLESSEWKSNEFTVIWYGNEAPTYTVREVLDKDQYTNGILFPEDYEFVSIRNNYTSAAAITTNELTDTLREEFQNILITIANKKRESGSGKLTIIKETETPDTINNNDNFAVTVEVKGKFKHIKDDGTIMGEYDTISDPGNPQSLPYSQQGTVSVDGAPLKVPDEGKFVWYTEDGAPEYTVKEELTDTQINTGIEFVSISNDEKSVTNTPSITGSFKDEEDDEVVIRILNNKDDTTTIIPKTHSSSLKINKMTVGDTDYLQNVDPNDLKYTFKVSLTGSFTYQNNKIINDTIYLTNTGFEKSDENNPVVELTLNTDGTIVAPWESDEITWDDSEDAPTFSVREVDIPKWAILRSWRSTTTSVGTDKIIGSVKDGVMVSLTAVNQIRQEYRYGSLKILKEVLTDNIKDLGFDFTVYVDGNFWYDGTYYSKDGLNEDGTPGNSNKQLIIGKYKKEDGTIDTAIEEINISASNQDGWKSKEFKWLSSEEAPTYRVVEFLEDKEDDEDYEGVEFVSISNGEQTNDENYIDGSLIAKKNNNGNPAGNPGTSDFDGVVTVTATNQRRPIWEWGFIQLHKELLDPRGNELSGDTMYNFNVTVTYYDKVMQPDGSKLEVPRTVKYPIAIKAGVTSRIEKIYWMKYEEKAPTFTIEEIIDPKTGLSVDIKYLDENNVFKDYTPGTKLTMKPGGIVEIKAENYYTNYNQGWLQIKKIVKLNDKLSDQEKSRGIKLNETYKFTFNVYVTGTFSYGGMFYDNETMQLKWEYDMIEADLMYMSDNCPVIWYGENAPTFVIEEVNIPNGVYLESMTNSSGTFVNGVRIEAVCTNIIRNRTIVDLTMEIGGKVWDDTDYLAGKDVDTQENGWSFDEPGIEGVKVRLYRVVTDQVGHIITRLNKVYFDDTYNGLDYKEGSEEPVTRTDGNGNWSFKGLAVPAFDPKTESQYIGSGYVASYDVEFSYDGQTWEPTTFLAPGNRLGPGIPGQPLIGDVGAFIGADSDTREDLWTSSSMVIDRLNGHGNVPSLNQGTNTADDRDAFNGKFETIKGYQPIDGSGETIGTTNAGVPLYYTSTDSVSLVNANNTRKISTFNPYDSKAQGKDSLKIRDEYLLKSCTSTGGLTFPFDRDIHLAGWDKAESFVDEGVHHYSATYNYLLHINLGLIKREAADVAIEKDLTEAVVVVNGKVLKYKYNSSINFDSILENIKNAQTDEERQALRDKLQDLLFKQIQVADQEIEYTLGLYSSDYYYRASIYGDVNGQNPNSDNYKAKNAMETFYGSLGYSSLEDLEMEVYLKYTMNVYNESETYDVKIGGIADYYDSSFTLIENPGDQATRYVQLLNGVEVNKKMELAEAPQLTIYNANQQVKEIKRPVSWNTSNTQIINGSDGVEYKKMTTDALANTYLASGDRAELTVTFKINKYDNFNQDINKIDKEIILGGKHNVVEITEFSAYYSTTSKRKWLHSVGEAAGRIDEDSAPDNVNIEKYNEKRYYEDDTDSAPVLYVELYNTKRNINGMVWEDAQTNEIGYSQVVGDGTYDPAQGDRNIPNMTTELVEIISIPSDGGAGATGTDVTYTEYEFIWPTDKELLNAGGGTKTVEEITGFDSTVKTNKGGNYQFAAVPAGNYKVRFVYGDKDIKTGNDVDEVYYSGQDYKSTAYQIGYDNDEDDDYYVDNEWHDLTNEELNSQRVSDARDSEARRLWISAKSEMLTYDNTSILETADEFHTERIENILKFVESDRDVSDAQRVIDRRAFDQLHNELYGYYEEAKGNPGPNGEVNTGENGSPVTGNGYYMYAETAKLNIEVENIYKVRYTTEPIGENVPAQAIPGNSVPSDPANSTPTNNVGALDVPTVEGGTDRGVVKTGKTYVYNINNIDFGLEERSQTKITLDKQIKEIELITSDGNVILDAIYDIYYDLDENGDYKALVTLNKEESVNYNQIASLNRTASSQGYRYLMVDSNILQGTTITITYQLSAFNVGEADTCNMILKELWTKLNSEDSNVESIKKLLEDAKTQFNSGSGYVSYNDVINLSGKDQFIDALYELTSPYYNEKIGRLTYIHDISNPNNDNKYQYGKYVGNIYYLGTQGTYIDKDKVGKYNTENRDGHENHKLSETDDIIMLVETTVHQIIDYVDPDVEFRDMDNIEVDQSWSTATIEYLLGEAGANGQQGDLLISPESVIAVDKNGVPLTIPYNGVGNTRDIKNVITDSAGNPIEKIRTYADGADTGFHHWTILNDELKEFIVKDYDNNNNNEDKFIKNNVVLNIDKGTDPVRDGGYLISNLVKPNSNSIPGNADLAGTNPNLVKAMIPYGAALELVTEWNENEPPADQLAPAEIVDKAKGTASASITLNVSRYYASEEDGEDVDNIAEIIKYENTVGRRDIRTIAGNTSTYELKEKAQGVDETVPIYQIAGKEPDTSATEIVTLTPPTGLNSITKLIAQIVLVTIVAASILAVGIILIRKKVLRK